jgi:two-component system cell cycle response regulator
MARLLIIEPNKIIAKQYSTYLVNKGHDVSVHSEAQAAIIAADSNKPDVIIMELLLTAHNGVEFLYELRSYSEWQNIPVIVLSRISQIESGISSKLIESLGISIVLYKPETSLAKLNSRIEKLLVKS